MRWLLLEENENDLNKEEYNNDDLEHSIYTDDLEKKVIDRRRMKKEDFSKKRAAVESVFDERTYFQLNKLIKNGPLDKIEGIISAGKEANVYLAYDRMGNEVAVKIYKIDRNTSRWMKNYIIGDPRFKKIPKNVAKVIFLWASKEYKNLKRAYRAGLNVPKPINVKSNILIMEYIGSGKTPAPILKDVKHPKDIYTLFQEIMEFIKELYQKASLVHGDLSEFNVLYHNHKPIFIDISQAVDIQHPKAEEYLVRDIKNIVNYFEKFGVNFTESEKFYYEVINKRV
ncbi:MAG: serine protein kinase RIO [Promethearchaeota archaeon]|nr:MAG: serine protein kinase RIO [Candidatus Lokiarchaeota archaeon]